MFFNCYIGSSLFLALSYIFASLADKSQYGCVSLLGLCQYQGSTMPTMNTLTERGAVLRISILKSVNQYKRQSPAESSEGITCFAGV